MKNFTRRNLLLALTLIGMYFTGYAQLFPLEGFENGVKPEGWTNEYVSGTEIWRYRNGGFNPGDPNNLIPAGDVDIARNPSKAYSGTYNAFFQKQGSTNERTKLITPAINLESAIKPELSFWLCQMGWTKSELPDFDVLKVYYKTGFNESWVLLQEFPDPVEDWTQVRINLPNPTSTYYVAFEAQNRWGFGVCIDDVVVEEKGVLPRYVSQMNIEHSSLSFVPSGTVNAPLLRIGVRIFGNTGSPILDQINVKSLNSNDSDIKDLGVKLYYTTSQTFSSSTLVGIPSSFSGGLVAFNDIGFTLPSGDSYIWVTYDVKEDATHGNYLDAMIEAEGIMLNDTLYPATNQSPLGRRTLYKTVYKEDFEDTHNWNLTGEFEVDILANPGLGGSPGNPNITNPYSGTKILGTDLTGLGANIGNYEPNLTLSTANLAMSPTLNLFYYKNIRLLFQRHLNIDWQDKAAIEASADGGSTWSTVWENSNLITEYEWSAQNQTLPTSIQRTSDFKMRYRLGPTSSSGNYSGWNIDDVAITAEFIAKDASITEWISPVTNCGHTDSESVTVRVANLGGADIVNDFNVEYSFNGGQTWVRGTVTDDILIGQSILYTFPTTVNLSIPGLRSNVKARTLLSGDQATENNVLTTSVYAIPTYSLPYSTNFEDNDGYWRASGASLWQYGLPVGETINSAGSGSNSWATHLSQSYGEVFTGSSQTIFDDDFETDKGWAFVSEFERGDVEWPGYPYEGSYYIGTDISGLGSNDYYYENGVTPATAYTATSPAIDISGYTDVEIEFRRYLRINTGDVATIQFSPDNGSTWVDVWTNDGVEVLDNDYTLANYPISNTYNGSTQMLFRFAITQTSLQGEVELGWNIDNFTVKGKPITPVPAYLESPCFNLADAVMPMFEAKLWVETEANVDGLSLYYTIDGGTTWEHVNTSSAYNSYWNWYNGNAVSELGVDGWSGSTGSWITVKQILPAEVVGVSDVKFRFMFSCDNMNNDFDGVAIDDIKIYETPFDFGTIAISNPSTTSCELSSAESVTATIENFGIRDMVIGDKLTVGIKIDYEGDYSGQSYELTEEKVLDAAFETGTTLNYTFTNKFDLHQPGEYTITVNTLVEDNSEFFSTPSNDAKTLVALVNRPYVDLGEDIYTVRPDNVTLDATNSTGGITYEWFDNEELSGASLSTSATYNVPLAGGNFWVRLTNTISCTTVDHILVQRLIADVGVTSFESPVSSCELSDETPFSVWVTNLGTDTLVVDDIITMSYQIGVEAAVEDIEWTLDQIILPGDSALYTFAGVSMDMSAETDYTLKASATVTDDNVTGNDELSKTISVWGYPTTFTLGLDVLNYVGTSYEVDAGAGWDAYYWQNDKSTGQKFTMTETGDVTATVYDENGCPATDEVYVELKFASVGPSWVVSPLSGCTFPNPVAPKFYIKNLGYEAIAAGGTLTYSFKLDDVEIETGELFLSSSFEPTDSVLIEFAETVDISAVDDYTFTFIATIVGDVKTDDDTKNHVVTVSGYPTTDLGDDVYTRDLTYELDAGTVAETYLWSTDETTKKITVEESGIYTVTATNGGICPAYDEVQVTFLVHDYALSSVISPVTACRVDDPHTVTARYTNVGNDILEAGESVQFRYTVNSGAPVIENFTLTSDLTPGNYIDYSFNQTLNLKNPGNYTFILIGTYAGDLKTSNNAKVSTITIHDLPTVYLGADTIVKSGSLTLDAGADLSYLWNDASTSQTLDVSATDEYYVTVTDGNGCEAYDAINVTWVTPDYGVTSIVSPNTACSLTKNESVTIIFKNLGTDILYPGEEIDLVLYLNTVLVKKESYQFLEEFYPGDVLEYTFNTKIDLSAPGMYNIYAEISHPLDKNSANDGKSRIINIWGNPVLTHDPLDPSSVCLNGEEIVLTGASPAGGTYSGVGVTGNMFDPAIAGAGIHSIIYSYTNTDTEPNCSSSINISVQVKALPEVTLNPFNSVCKDSAPIELTGGSPANGAYTSTQGIEDGFFHPSEVDAGAHAITYTYTDPSTQCTNTATENITVNSLPVVTLDLAVKSICVNASSIVLSGGSPAGGVYSGTGVNSGNFNPAGAGSGTHTITYTYTAGTGCTSVATEQITVNPLPIIEFTSVDPLCRDKASILLNMASPSGGNYSGTGTSGGYFDPGTAQIGNNTIYYNYTDGNGCSSSSSFIIKVNPLPTVTLAALDPVCVDVESVELGGGLPVSGTFSGTEVSGGYFNPSVAGAGSYPITYTYTDANGCASSAMRSITVNALPTITLPSFGPYCHLDQDIALTGINPIGGVLSGNGVTGGDFNPVDAGVGSHTITYNITDGNGCANSAQTDIEVNTLPEVSISSISGMYITSPPLTLTQGSPVGGTYSGSGVSGGVFSPDAAGIGTHTITYNYTDGNGCASSAQTTIRVYDVTHVVFTLISSICIDESSIELTGGEPAGGTYSGTGVTGVIFNPAVAGVGTHTLTYTVIDELGNPNSETAEITVHQLSTITFNSLGTICMDVTQVELNQASPVGGTYSGQGVEEEIFSPTSIGAGTYSITYTYTDEHGCTNSASQNIQVFDLPVVTLGNLNSVCLNQGEIELDAGLPVGGDYSGSGVSGNSFQTSVGVGTYSISYTYTDGNGCSSADSKDIVVLAIPTVTLAPFSSVCANANPFTLTGGSPAGGEFSGSGVVDGIFSPAVAGSGTHVITYTYTDTEGNGCSNTATQEIVVLETPVVTLASFDSMCINSEAITLTGGSPAGGVFSGTGVTNGIFTPTLAGVGSHQITYTYTDTEGNGCTNSAIQTIDVMVLPEVTLAAFTPVCLNSEPITLTGGQPEGGVYSGVGVSEGAFNPALAGTGSHTITYSYTNTGGNGCFGYASQELVVLEVPTVTLSPFDPVCNNDSPLTLSGGEPTGGVYSGTGVSDGLFSPAVAGSGTHIITYLFTDGNGCSNTATQEIVVLELPDVSLASFESMCINSEAITLTGGLPAGGVFSGSGVVDDVFTPSAAGIGNHQVNYTYTDTEGNGCTNSASQTIDVMALPEVTLAAFTPVCLNSEPITLTGGLPEGGVYSGDGVSEGIFNPAIAGSGSHTITYIYTNTGGNGCSNSATQNIEVFELPVVSLDSFDPICYNASPLTLSEGDPEGGVYSGDGVSEGLFTPAVAGAGIHTITYTAIDLNGCNNSATSSIEVYAPVVVTFATLDAVCANSEAVELAGGNPAGGAYSGIGVSEGMFTPSTAGAGTHEITYTITDQHGCVYAAISNIQVYANPEVDLGGDRTVSEPFNLDAGSGFASYKWQDGSANQTFFVQYAGTYSVEVEDNNGCSGSDEATITFDNSLITVVELLSPVSGECESDKFIVEIKVANKRGAPIAAGEKLTMKYLVQGGNPVQEEFELAENLDNNGEFIFTFSEPLNLESGDKIILLSVGYDELPGNVLTETITVHPNPVFSLGNDVEVSLPHTLEAGIADVLYLWSTGSVESSIVINDPGKYWLTVTNGFGCAASDTINITASWIKEIPGTGTIVSVFPNPASLWLTVDIQPQKPASFIIELISPNGQRVYSKSMISDEPFTHRIDVNEFNTGLYLLRVSTGGKWISVKVVIQR